MPNSIPSTDSSIVHSSSPSVSLSQRHFITATISKGADFFKNMISHFPFPSLPRRKRNTPPETSDTPQTKKQRISGILKDSIAKKSISFEANSHIISTAAFAAVTLLAAK